MRSLSSHSRVAAYECDSETSDAGRCRGHTATAMAHTRSNPYRRSVVRRPFRRGAQAVADTTPQQGGAGDPWSSTDRCVTSCAGRVMSQNFCIRGTRRRRPKWPGGSMRGYWRTSNGSGRGQPAASRDGQARGIGTIPVHESGPTDARRHAEPSGDLGNTACASASDRGGEQRLRAWHPRRRTRSRRPVVARSFAPAYGRLPGSRLFIAVVSATVTEQAINSSRSAVAACREQMIRFCRGHRQADALARRNLTVPLAGCISAMADPVSAKRKLWDLRACGLFAPICIMPFSGANNLADRYNAASVDRRAK